MSEEYPWLCSPIKDTSDYLSPECDDTKTSLANTLTDEGLGSRGFKGQYYVLSFDTKYDSIFGEDRYKFIERSFYFMGYTDTFPSNVREYQLQGILGADIFNIYISKTSFAIFSTYGGEDKNQVDTYNAIKPSIGDIIYIKAIDTFYSIIDVKKYTEAFNVKPHSWTLTLKVYKPNEDTIINSETIDNTDPIYNVATSANSAIIQFDDYLKVNDIISAKNNEFSIPNNEYINQNNERKTDIDPFSGW